MGSSQSEKTISSEATPAKASSPKVARCISTGAFSVTSQRVPELSPTAGRTLRISWGEGDPETSTSMSSASIGPSPSTTSSPRSSTPCVVSVVPNIDIDPRISTSASFSVCPTSHRVGNPLVPIFPVRAASDAPSRPLRRHQIDLHQ